MKLSLVERETILLYNQAEPMAEVYTHRKHHCPIIMRLLSVTGPCALSTHLYSSSK